MCRCRQQVGPHDHLSDPQFLRDGASFYGTSLNNSIDFPKVRAWNTREGAEGAVRLLHLGETNSTLLHSDADDQVLLFVPFCEFVRLKGICVRGSEDNYSPATLKLFVNHSEMISGFDTVERWRPEMSILLSQSGSGDDVIYRLDPAKFLQVSVLVLFFVESFNRDETHLNAITFFGDRSGQSVNRPLATTVVYELWGNPADHPALQEEKPVHIL